MKNKLVSVMFMLCLSVPLALAQTDAATEAVTDDATMARLRVAYIVFNGPNVDVLIDGEIARVGAWEQADLSCCGMTGYTYLAPGTHSVEVAPTGRGLEEALLSADMELEAGHRYTLATMGQIEDESLTPLVIDETTAVREARTDPSQEIIILVNNLKGAEAFSFTVDGQGIHDVPYGGFAAAPNPMSATGDFEFSANGGKDILDAAQDLDYLVTPGIDFMHLRFGHLPGTWGEDHSDTQGMPVTELNTLEFLRGFSGPDVQHRAGPSFNNFLEAVEKSGLAEMLESENLHWLLPPTDEAFATFPQERLDAVMADPEALADLVRNHIAEGYFPDLPSPATNLRGVKLEGIDFHDFYLSTNGSHVSPISTVLLPPDEACLKAQAAQVSLSPRSLKDHIASMWLFDEGQGDTAGDASGHNYHGTFVNAAWAEGKFGSAAQFTPGESYVEVEATDEALSPADEMTITAWVYLQALPDLEEQFPNRRIVEAATYDPAEFEYGGADNHYGLHFQWGSFIFRPGRHAFPDRVGIDQSEAIEPGRWQHVAGVYSGDHIRLYVNGELRSETEANCMALTQPPDNRLFIGTKSPQAPDGDWWDGLIDEVAIFDVALSEEEIGTVMQGLGAIRAD